MVALSVTAVAQPPDMSPNSRARSKPQVIYHLPSSSSSAATLHSQAKTPVADLPIEGHMPTSLQMSRSNANAAQAQVQAEQTPVPTASPVRLKPSRQITRSQSRPHSSFKPMNRENSHGKKSHKK